MKRLLLIALLLITACHKIDLNQQQAVKLVKSYIKNHPLNGQGTYDGLSFGKLIAVKTNYIETKEGIALNNVIEMEDDSMAQIDNLEFGLLKKSKTSPDSLSGLSRQNRNLLRRQNVNTRKLLSMTLKFKGILKGYKILHYYKITGDFNVDIYHKMIFYIDPTISKVILAKDTVIDANDIQW